MNLRILAIGTRGDVQPYVALGRGLRASGLDVSLATTANFRDFVEKQGLPCLTADVDMQAIMQSQAGRQTAGAGRDIRKLLRQNILLSNMPVLLEGMWQLSQGADALLYSGIGRFAAPHIAEKLGIPAIPAPLQPLLHPTAAFPPVVAPPLPLAGAAYNRLAHHVFEQVSWVSTRRAINTFRVRMLGLPPALRGGPYRALRADRTPALYGFSPHVVPHPADWPAHAHITGYWFLDSEPDWTPDPALVRFLEAGPPPVYIGFGSMTAADPQETLPLLSAAVQQAGVRAIIASGWAGLSGLNLPPEILVISGAPHDWLFPRLAAVVHHGGAGTTAAGLRAGVPTVIVPHFTDQFFWGERVYDLGASPQPIPHRHLTSERLAYAIRVAAEHGPMRARAAALGEKLRAEDGVGTAVRLITQYLQKHSPANH